MAVDLSGAWCVQFGEQPDYWQSSVGTFEQSGAASCTRPWVVLPSTKFAELVALNNGATTGQPQFTADEVAALKSQAAVGLTIQIEPKPSTPEGVQDLTLTFGLMFMALIGVWGARQLYNVFNRGPNDND